MGLVLMSKADALCRLLDIMEIPYAKTIPACGRYAIDDFHLSGYEVNRFESRVSADDLLDLYDKLIWNWVWMGGPLLNSDWGWDSSGKHLPLILINPLTKSKVLYCYGGVVLVPHNVHVIADPRYLQECTAIYEVMKDKYDRVLESIIRLNTSVSIRNDLLDTYIKSFKSLENIILGEQ